MLSSNHDRRRQQLQQYNNQTQIDKAIKRILIISPDDDVNLALKTALEQVEGGDADGGYNFRVECFSNPV